MTARWLLPMWAAVSVAACDGPHCDVAAIIQKTAGPSAIACGELHALDDDEAALRAAHDCIVAAIDAGVPFYASIDWGVSDGTAVVAYASDGRAVHRLDYQFAVGQLFGPNHESLSARTCGWFADRGRSCDDLWRDLCFACRQAEPIAISRCAD